MKVVVVFLGLALLLGVAACSRSDDGASPLLDESAPYEITRAAGTPTLEPATSPAFTPTPTISPPTSGPPTKRPSLTPSPTKRPTIASTTIVAGYTRKEEPCDRDRGTAPSVYHQELGGGLCAFYYPPETQAGTVPFESINKGYWSDLHPRDPTLLVSGVNEGLKARVFLGVRATGGYGIHVVNVAVEEKHIRLTVVVTSPLPSQTVFAAMTHPFHVVVIAKEDIVSPPGTTWSMVTKDGKVLAETVYPPAPAVPFFSIAKGAAGSPRLDVGRGPDLEIVRNSGDLEALIRWNRPGYVPRRVKEGLQGIQPSATWVVVAYLGAKEYGKIAIQEVRLDEGQVIVTVVITSLPRRAAPTLVTHPYHVVGISKQDMLVSPRANWLMVTEDGTVLAETSPDRIARPGDPVVIPDEKQTDAIPFQSVAGGDLGASLGRDPGLLVARGRDELEEVVGSLNTNALLRRDVWGKLPGNDSANVWVAIVFSGVRVTGGFGIFVQDVR